MIIGGVLNVVGCGLTGLLSPETPTGQWVGYQILFGAGRGLAMLVVSYPVFLFTGTKP
jgi:hypothetical protein